MQTETLIATIRAEMALSQELQDFVSNISKRDDAGTFRESGDRLLAEFGNEWNANFIEVAQSVFGEYFRELGLPEDRRPKVKLTDSRRGSWIMSASVVIVGSTVSVCMGLEIIENLPALANKIENIKGLLQKKLFVIFNERVGERIRSFVEGYISPVEIPLSTQFNFVTVNCAIDARPLQGLNLDVAKSHAIQLAVTVSRFSLSVQNLGTIPIKNLKVGIFKSKELRSSWSFDDAYYKYLPIIGGGQLVCFGVDQFLLSPDNLQLDLSDSIPLYIDCLLQNNSGIYLFHFYLD